MSTSSLHRAFSLVLSIAIASAFFAAPTSADQLQPLQLSTFTVPTEITIGMALGYFEREGLDIQLDPVPGSAEQLQRMLDGRADIATTSADNIVYWVEDLGADVLVVSVGASPLDQSLFVGPQIQTFEDLRGTTLGVDSASSGYATVLRSMLLKNGLVADRDYRMREVGNTGARTQALVDGEISGSMLGESQVNFIAQAEAGGGHLLGRGADYVPLYPATPYVVSRDWAADNPQLVLSFLRAVIQTRDWLRDPGNRDEALRIVMDASRLNADQAQDAYEAALVAAGGPDLDSQVRTDMLQMIVDMRAETGLLATPAPPASKYITPNWFQLALQTLRQ